ncbi:origin recognition complex subunit 3 N-terminus-domain-containing protein [Geopyxis carbonaria]|nr:origin recognition complex subunit 3 N-terminus-domain-containing protein [Geopyxis carbonaria]
MVRATSLDNSDDGADSFEHQTCYLFTPSGADPSTARFIKRRRTSKGKGLDLATQVPEREATPFKPLFNGETEEAVRTRWETYNRLWTEQERRTKNILESFNIETLDNVSKFVKDANPQNCDGRKIPTALVLAGPNIASHGPLFKQFTTRIRDIDQQGPVVVLTSKDAVNLKAALKKIIRDATLQDEGLDEDDEELIVGRKGAKLLNYDLQILQNWHKLHEGQKVTVAIQDTEAFDAAVLADLIGLFSAYLDRIPFVLLIGIATSLDLFHEKLPKAAMRLMQGEKFDVERAEECLARIFNDAVASSQSVLRLGPEVSTIIIERQKEHTQSIQGFVAALKYAYMTHFYGNPLSIIFAYLDDEDGLFQALTDDHVEAIRNTGSFRRAVQNKVMENDTEEARALVNDHEYLRAFVWQSMQKCRMYATDVSQGLEVFELSRNCLSSTTGLRNPRHELYPEALLGELHVESPMVRELLLGIKKMNSESLLRLIDTVVTKITIGIPDLVEHLVPIKAQIEKLISEAGDGNRNLTSEFDIATNVLRTTAVSKKIQLDKHKSGLTKNDAEFSKLVQKVHNVLEEYFRNTLKGLGDLFLHEIFFYDLPFPHKHIFAPRIRSNVELALSRPSHYLVCECCQSDEDDENTLKASNPPTSIVYQLFLESGTLINGFDLWSAFNSVLQGDEDNEEGAVDELTAQALFFRSVAEMKFMGFLKQTRKRVDHLQKIAWKGL